MTVRDIIGNIEVQSGHRIIFFDDDGKFCTEGKSYDITGKDGAEDLEILYMWCNNDELCFEVRLDDSCEIVPDGVDRYQRIVEKFVPDCDGFMDSYTMYKDIVDGKYVFIFGDPDYCVPEDGDFDWECETEAEAQEWFENYKGSNDSSVA